MRNPNGYGSVYKLSGNRRKPWIVRKTIGWDDNGKQIYQTIGYYEKRDLALLALAEFNKNPYSIEASTITFQEVYRQWSESKFEGISRSGVNGYKAAFEVCSSLYDIKFVDIRAKHMQDVVKSCGKGYGSLRKLKVLFNQLFKYAMENDIVNKDYSDFVDIGKNNEGSKRKVFTLDEINRMFELVNDIDYLDTVLVMIYTGLRIGELLIIKTSDVNLENRIITGGIKTEAGKNRVIPINSKIFNLVSNRVDQGYEYLISKPEDKPISYDNYYKDKFIPIMNKLGYDHKPHDCRHTFATLMANAGADKISLQKIIGHADYATTANIYTHKDIEQLKKAIDLI